MVRQLVITADDLGADVGINAVIVDLLRDGLITTTTLLPPAPAADDAVARLLAAGFTAPRLHVALSTGREWAGWRPLTSGPSLTGPDGAMPVDGGTAERRATPGDVTREMEAQLTWMRAAGLHPPGLDSHSGTLYGLHGGPSLAVTAVDFCAAHGLDFRLPRRLGVLGLAGRGLRTAHHTAVRHADEQGVRLPASLVSSWLPGGMVLTYRQLRAEVLAQLRHLPQGTSELIVHPAPRAAAQRLGHAEGRKRLWELRLLRDPAFHRTLRREGLTLVPAW